MRVLVTGGCGFVGSTLAELMSARGMAEEVVSFDNLRRRGAEQNVPRLLAAGVSFVHGDVRCPTDFESLEGVFDLVVDAAAEPSVHAGTGGDGTRYLFDTNLGGTFNCLEFCRRRAGALIFLSTSRVYSVNALRAIRLETAGSRFVPASGGQPAGFSAAGVQEGFPTAGPGGRSLYGTTKLASELLVEEYASTFDVPAAINRCGVIAGPGQFGKVEQGVFTLWVARHLFGGSLAYHGFGGEGRQVRDLLHPRDLCALLEKQIAGISGLRGQVFGVGGGMQNSVSLQEYTAICRDVTGREIDIGSRPETADVDIPFFVTDHERATAEFGWQPQCSPRDIAGDICAWLRKGGKLRRRLFES